MVTFLCFSPPVTAAFGRDVRRAMIVYKFPPFEFHPGTGRLRKHGLRIKLQQKPQLILTALLGRPGETVTRQELYERLWPEGVHVDFEQGLNVAIKKLRDALGDVSDSPRYILTVAGLGYRFIGELEPERPEEDENRIGSLAETAVGQDGNAPSEPSSEEVRTDNRLPSQSWWAPPPGAARRQGTWLTRSFRLEPLRLALYVVLIFALAGALVLANRYARATSAHLSARRSIAVLGFTNLNRDARESWIDPALSQWINTELASGGRIRIIPKEAIDQIRSQLGLQDDPGRLSAENLRKIKTNLDPDLVVTGSYVSLGDERISRLRLDLQVRDASSGEILHTVSVTGTKPEVSELALQAGDQLRSVLQIGPFSAGERNAILAMLPSNPDAARLYTEGFAQLERSDAMDARALLGQAIAIEPGHALSHAALSYADSSLGFAAEAAREARQALDLSTGLPLEEKMLVEGQYRETRDEWDKAIEIYRSLFALYPERVEYGLRLAHTETLSGNSAMAFETIRRLRELKLPATAVEETDLAEAEAAAAIADFRRQEATAAKAGGVARQTGNTLVVAKAEVLEGEAQRSLGDYESALAGWEDAKNIFASYGDRSSVIGILIDEGRLQRQRGDLALAEQLFDEAIATSRQIGDQANLGRALSALGQFKMHQVSGELGRKLSAEAVAIFQRIGNKQEEAYALSLVADTLFAHRAHAKQLYQRSLELSREANDRSRTAGRLMDLGIIATLECDLATAERDLSQALQIYHETGERNREALQLKHLANVYMWEGRLKDAENLDRQAIALVQSDVDANIRGEVRQNLADVQREAGELGEAEQSLRLAISEHRQANDYGYVKIAEIHLAEILAMEGRDRESREALVEYDRVVPWARPQGVHEIMRMWILARLDQTEGRHQEALRKAQRGVAQALAADEPCAAMRARMLLGEIELADGKHAAGQRELKQLSNDAAAKGFYLIQRQAQELLSTETARLPGKSSNRL